MFDEDGRLRLIWWIAGALIAIACATCARTSKAATPAGELADAVADIKTLSPVEAQTTRYLSLYGVSKEKRRQLAQVTSYTLNALSRSRYIQKPKAVTPTLLRFNFYWYAPTRKDYEEWVQAWYEVVKEDAYWHIKTEVLDPHDGKKKTTTVAGGWIGLNNHQTAKQLAYTDGLVLRADMFVATASQPPHYYAFTGVPPLERDFLAQLGIDPVVIERLRANTGANLLQSNITKKNRRVIWTQGPLGGIYETLDMNAVTADRDVLRRPVDDDDLKLKYDAGEWFAMAPNHLWRNALYDSAGKRQDAVPDAIAKDDHGDGRVVPFVSCIRCHHESGLRPFRDDQKLLLQGVPGKPTLYSYKPELINRTLEFYDEERLLRQMQFDRDTYDSTLRRVFWEPTYTAQQLAVALTNVVQDFTYEKVTPVDASRELGVESIANLRRTRDPILLLLIEGRGVLRGQFESAYSEAALAVETWRTNTVRNKR